MNKVDENIAKNKKNTNYLLFPLF